MIRSTTATWLALTLALLHAVARSAPAPDGPGRQPEVWAVLVGIDLYNDPAIPRCLRANREGAELARWLTETAHWDRRHVLLMNEFGLRRHGRPEDHVTPSRPPARI